MGKGERERERRRDEAPPTRNIDLDRLIRRFGMARDSAELAAELAEQERDAAIADNEALRARIEQLQSTVDELVASQRAAEPEEESDHADNAE